MPYDVFGTRIAIGDTVERITLPNGGYLQVGQQDKVLYIDDKEIVYTNIFGYTAGGNYPKYLKVVKKGTQQVAQVVSNNIFQTKTVSKLVKGTVYINSHEIFIDPYINGSVRVEVTNGRHIWSKESLREFAKLLNQIADSD